MYMLIRGVLSREISANNRIYWLFATRLTYTYSITLAACQEDIPVLVHADHIHILNSIILQTLLNIDLNERVVPKRRNPWLYVLHMRMFRNTWSRL